MPAPIESFFYSLFFHHLSSDNAKKCQQAFLAPLLGLDSISISSNDVKKYQQAFIALLLGKVLVKKNLVGHTHDDINVW